MPCDNPAAIPKDVLLTKVRKAMKHIQAEVLHKLSLHCLFSVQYYLSAWQSLRLSQKVSADSEFPNKQEKQRKPHLQGQLMKMKTLLNALPMVQQIQLVQSSHNPAAATSSLACSSDSLTLWSALLAMTICRALLCFVAVGFASRREY